MPKRPLTSDELGEHGDAIFRTLCTKSGLVANKSERDRTGWDYRVEFPNSRLSNSVHADKRDIPLPFNVQVKTMWWDNNGFKAPLVAAERLAKSLDPSFIVVIRVLENIDKFEFFIIHMVGRPLEKVLKKLVEISTKGEAVSNNIKLSFTKDETWRQIDIACLSG